MAIVRWEPVRELQGIQQEMNRLLGTFFDTQAGSSGGDGGWNARRWIPAMDLLEKQDHFLLHADLPGVSEQDVKIELEGEVLTVSGERKSEQQHGGDGYVRIERAAGSFTRTLTLPEGIDPGSIEASFENGVLEISIPKPEQRKPHRVSISLGGKTVDARQESSDQTAPADSPKQS